jgi:hypothetical protein
VEHRSAIRADRGLPVLLSRDVRIKPLVLDDIRPTRCGWSKVPWRFPVVLRHIWLLGAKMDARVTGVVRRPEAFSSD